MHKIFPGYKKKTQDEIRLIWKEGIIMFDANVLLNLYQYSESTREALVNLIRKYKRQIWLPHQSALEYNRNRYNIISRQEQAYRNFIKTIDKIKEDLQTKNKPPFLSKAVQSRLDKAFSLVNGEVESSIRRYADYLSEDPIYDTVSSLFESRITDPFSTEEYRLVCEEGERRFANKIPPGYKDEKDKAGDRKFGDLIIWKQLLLKAKELSKPVIFVTDERKEDWWWKTDDNKTIGPRHERVAEVMKEANVGFHMYSSERFLIHGQSQLKEAIDEEAIKEIEALKRAQRDARMRERRLIDKNRQSKREEEEERQRIVSERRHRIIRSLRTVEEQLAERTKYKRNELGQDEYFEALEMRQKSLHLELSELQNSYKDSDQAKRLHMRYAAQYEPSMLLRKAEERTNRDD